MCKCDTFLSKGLEDGQLWVPTGLPGTNSLQILRDDHNLLRSKDTELSKHSPCKNKTNNSGCSSKIPLKRAKRQATTEWANISALCLSNNHTARIFLGSTDQSEKEKDNPTGKWGKVLNRHFANEVI